MCVGKVNNQNGVKMNLLCYKKLKNTAKQVMCKAITQLNLPFTF